jgi:hypothetical protein
MFIPPTQPFNVPTTKEIYKTTNNVVVTVFGEPKKVTKDGLWYSIIDYTYGLFIPCITKSNVTIPEAPMLLKPIHPSFMIDRDYIVAAMGLLAEINKNAALTILKQYF